MPLDTSVITRRIRAMSDDALRSEYVAATRPEANCDIVALVIQSECRLEAKRRKLPLRDREAVVRELLDAMEGW